MNWIIEFKKALAEFGLEGLNKYYGSYRGTIVSNDDPLHLGRLTLKVPQVWGSGSYNYWAWPKGQFCGNGIGFYAIPNEGDLVWVSFENGNPKYPLWEYGHFGGINNRIETAKSVKQKVFQVTNGMRFVFDEEANKIQLYHSDKRVVEINEKGISLGTENESSYHALIGENTEAILDKLISICDTFENQLIQFSATQATASASAGILAPMTAGYTALGTALAPLVADIVKLKLDVKKIKSEIVTLD